MTKIQITMSEEQADCLAECIYLAKCYARNDSEKVNKISHLYDKIDAVIKKPLVKLFAKDIKIERIE